MSAHSISQARPGAVCTVEEKVYHQQLEGTLAPVKDFAAVSRVLVDWRPRCSARTLDGVKSQYKFWAAALHLLILLDPVKDLPQAAWVVGPRSGSDSESLVPRPIPRPVRRGGATISFTYGGYCPPERTGSRKYPSQGTPLREFLEPGVPEPDLTWPIPE
jgi:hypothetical protein